MYSMTGFGSSEGESTNYKINIEIKSVNNRFRDIRFRMPNFLSFVEIPMRKKIESLFKRGSFDVYISLKKESKEDLLIDFEKLNGFLKTFENKVKTNLNITLSPGQFLRSEFQVDQDLSKDDKELLAKNLLDIFEKACVELKSVRKSEGESIKGHLENYVDMFEKEYLKIKTLSKDYRLEVEEKFNESFEKFKKKFELDEGRFNQEVIHTLEKMDIQEEIDRLEVHLKKLRSLFEKEEIGRQIDFLLQEINRETNTVGAKSNSSEISSSVVQMKTFLEKVREQNLNIE
jgi:uncharacterized protein (TIGR00255 family)